MTNNITSSSQLGVGHAVPQDAGKGNSSRGSFNNINNDITTNRSSNKNVKVVGMGGLFTRATSTNNTTTSRTSSSNSTTIRTGNDLRARSSRVNNVVRNVQNTHSNNVS